jgi:hypothetical protein
VKNPRTGASAAIDVKGLLAKTVWPIQEPRPEKTHFYALICYEGKFTKFEETPRVFIVPSTEMKQPLLEQTRR